MIKYFKRAFKITNDNIILTTPFVLFLLLLSIYFGIVQNAPVNIFAALLLLITSLFMTSAFLAGWFFMVKKAIDLDKKEFIVEEEKAKASFGLIKELPAGIGEFFLPVTGGLILYITLIALFSVVSYKIGMHFIGSVDLSLLKIKMAMNSPAAMKSLISALSKDQLIKLEAWNLLILSTMILFSFITMFWGAHVFIKNKNPLIAFFQSLKFIFKNFLSSIVLFVYISFINFFVSIILNVLGVVNPFIYFVSILIYFYFVVYVVVLVFLYYDSEATAKTESNCNSGADSIGQEQISDTKSSDD